MHPYIQEMITTRISLTLNDCSQIFESLRDTCVNEVGNYPNLVLDMVDIMLRFVEKDNEDT